MTNREIFLLSILMFLLGGVIDPSGYKELTTIHLWLVIINDFAVIIGALATTIAALCAWNALSRWKSEHNWKRFSDLKYDFLLSLYEYNDAVLFHGYLGLNQTKSLLMEEDENVSEDDLNKAKEDRETKKEILLTTIKKIGFILNNKSCEEKVLFIIGEVISLDLKSIPPMVDIDREDVIKYENKVNKSLENFLIISDKVRNELDRIIKT